MSALRSNGVAFRIPTTVRVFTLLFLLAQGCSGTQVQQQPDHNPTVTSEPPQPPAESGQSPRLLALEATYTDLVAAARTMDDATSAQGSENCLLRGDGIGAYRFEGDIAVAVRPLPDPPEDLDEWLGNSTSMVSLTRWGEGMGNSWACRSRVSRHCPPVHRSL